MLWKASLSDPKEKKRRKMKRRVRRNESSVDLYFTTNRKKKKSSKFFSPVHDSMSATHRTAIEKQAQQLDNSGEMHP